MEVDSDLIMNLYLSKWLEVFHYVYKIIKIVINPRNILRQ